MRALRIIFAITAFVRVGGSTLLGAGGWDTPPTINSTNIVTWKCPSNESVTVSWSSLRLVLTEMDGKNERDIKDVESAFISDYLGVSSMPNREFRWKGGLLITKNQFGLGVLDTAQARFLINNAFDTFFEVSADRFFTHPYHPVPRKSSWEFSGFTDKIYVVDLNSLSNSNPSRSMEDHVFKTIPIPGVLVSPFIQLSNLDLAAFIVKEGGLSIISINPESCEVTVKAFGPVQSKTLDIVKSGGLDRGLLTTYKSRIDAIR